MCCMWRRGSSGCVRSAGACFPLLCVEGGMAMGLRAWPYGYIGDIAGFADNLREWI